MKHTVWLIGGTKDSVAIANKISVLPLSLIITVATPEAKHLYNSQLGILSGCMNQEEIMQFCRDKIIVAIIDASHPFAVEVSQNAIATATNLNIPYLRYERDSCPSDGITVINSFEILLQEEYLLEKRVLLTVGCKVLPKFLPWQDKCTLFTRVLPKLESLQTAIAAGFTSDRIIALRPP